MEVERYTCVSRASLSIKRSTFEELRNPDLCKIRKRKVLNLFCDCVREMEEWALYSFRCFRDHFQNQGVYQTVLCVLGRLCCMTVLDGITTTTISFTPSRHKDFSYSRRLQENRKESCKAD